MAVSIQSACVRSPITTSSSLKVSFLEELPQPAKDRTIEVANDNAINDLKIFLISCIVSSLQAIDILLN